MALITLVIIGILVSWFASIVARVEEGRAMRRMVLVGLAASIVVGLAVNSGTFLGSASWTAMGAGALAAALANAGYRYYLSRG